MPATLERERIKVLVEPFTVEIDHPRNADVLLQCIIGCRLRSLISSAKPITVHTADGREESRIPQDQTRDMGMLPVIPGMQLTVYPEKCSYRIYDPLTDDEDMCDRIQKVMDDRGVFRSSSKLRGVPTRTGTLDQHRFKSLCRELLWLLDANHAKMVKGVQPTMEDVGELPGDYLLNPGSQVNNTQPRFEREWDAWYSRLVQSGG